MEGIAGLKPKRGVSQKTKRTPDGGSFDGIQGLKRTKTVDVSKSRKTDQPLEVKEKRTNIIELDHPRLFARPLTDLPRDLKLVKLNPRYKGSFFLPVHKVGHEQVHKIARLCSITPKDVSQFFGGKPPEPYTLTNMTTIKGVEHFHVKPHFGYMLWGQPRSVIEPCFYTDIAFRGNLCNGEEGSVPQIQTVDIAEKFLKDNLSKGLASCLIVAPTGSGKTVMALNLAHRLGVCTGIVLHRNTLIKQWKRRISTFCPGARVGMICGDVCDVFQKDFILIAIDSLLGRAERFGEETWCPEPEDWDELEEFRFPGVSTRTRTEGKLPKGKKYPYFCLQLMDHIIFDEAHHIAAPTYSMCPDLLPSAYKTYWTATPKRSGKLCPELSWITGPTVVQIKRVWEDVKVRAFRYVNSKEQNEIYIKGGSMLATWLMTKQMVYSFQRNDLIMDQIKWGLKRKRHILIFSERTKHLEFLKRRIDALDESEYGHDDRFKQKAGILSSGLSDEEEQEVHRSRVILATYSMANEGFDVPTLDMMVLSTARSNIEQAVGRILRPCPNKPVPIVVDIFEEYSDFYLGQWRKRYRYYQCPEPEFSSETYFSLTIETCDYDDEDVDEDEAELCQHILDEIPSDSEDEM